MDSASTQNTTTVDLKPPRYYEILLNFGWSEAILLLAIAIITKVVYNAYLHPLRKIPGPFLAGVTELWITKKYYGGNWHQDILDLHRQYGPVVRVTPNEVSFVDRAALEQVYGHFTGTKKTSWYDTWIARGYGANIFSTTNVQEHSFLRKRLAPAYTKTALVSQEGKIQQVFDHLWSRFRQFAQDGQEFDIQVYANYLAFDVVSQLGMNGAIGFIDNGDATGIMRAIHQIFYTVSLVGYLPGQMLFLQWPIVEKIMEWIGGPSGFKYFRKWVLGQVQSRLAEDPQVGSERGKDVLDHFISMKEADGTPATVASVMAEVGNLIGAGADTAAVGMAVVLGQLWEHPEDLEKLRREVDKAYQDLASSGQESAELTLRQMEENLPFLNACVQEATRLCPSITWQLPREAPEAGITIAGHYIPPGASLAMSPVSQNRCKEVFGDDADEWRPQRLVPNGEEIDDKITKSERQRKMDKYNVTFGYGTRVCIGRHLASMEMIKFICQFVRQFEFEAVNKANPFQPRSQWWCQQTNFLVRLKVRNHDVEQTN